MFKTEWTAFVEAVADRNAGKVSDEVDKILLNSTECEREEFIRLCYRCGREFGDAVTKEWFLLRCLGADAEFAKAVRESLCERLYKEFREEN